MGSIHAESCALEKASFLRAGIGQIADHTPLISPTVVRGQPNNIFLNDAMF